MSEAENIKQWLEDRDKALTAFVMEDDFSAVVTYALNYGIPFSDNLDAFKLAMLKAAFSTKSLLPEVRDLAAKKCRTMGFSPEIREI